MTHDHMICTPTCARFPACACEVKAAAQMPVQTPHQPDQPA